MHHNNSPIPRAPKRHTSGFSIVEVLVAGALLGIAVIAVVAVVQKSGDLQSAGSKRNAARMFLATRFENEYGAEKYAFVQQPTTNPVITPFGESDTGILYTTVIADNVSGVPIKKITLTLSWTDIGSSRDSITLSKWLAE